MSFVYRVYVKVRMFDVAQASHHQFLHFGHHTTVAWSQVHSYWSGERLGILDEPPLEEITTMRLAEVKVDVKEADSKFKRLSLPGCTFHGNIFQNNLPGFTSSLSINSPIKLTSTRFTNCNSATTPTQHICDF